MGKTNKLETLLAEFKKELPVKMAEIETAWILLNDNKNESILKELHELVTSLADAGGTYSATEVSHIARKLALALKAGKSSLSQGGQTQINEWIEQLKKSAEEWLSSDTLLLKPAIQTDKRLFNVIYTFIKDELLKEEIKACLEKTNFKVQNFSTLDALEAACTREPPSIVVIDNSSDETNTLPVDAIKRLKNKRDIKLPVVLISDNDDIELRLAATRAGVERFFSKPVLMNKLVNTLTGLNTPPDEKPCRVLIIDNDIPLLQCYTEILRESGMVVEALSEPLEGLKALEKFKPDIIVMDIFMPQCSGTELVGMIRQDDRWELIPVVFLSGEQDINNQLDAMRLGADDFLVKPVQPNKFELTIKSVIKRARQNVKLNRDLKNVLQENKYQLVTLDQHAIVSTADVAGRITHVNDKLCEISGYSRDELLGNNHRILKSKYHSKLFFEELWSTISKGQIWHGVICNNKKGGGKYWVDSTIVPFLNSKGKPYKYVSIRTDVTQLRESENRLARSQEFANIGTWDWDIITGQLFWSDKIWPLFGYDVRNTATTYENFIEAVHPEDREQIISAVNRCVENYEIYDIEHRVVWPDGSVHWMHESGDVIRAEDGTALHMLGVVRDITEIKKVEKSLIEAREEAENANLAKSHFLSSMSHELRTPMNAIMGFSQLLTMNKSSQLDEKQKNNVNEIMVAGKHLMNLINEVLDLAKIESGHIELTFEMIVLSQVILESLQLITPLAQKRGIEIFLKKNNKEMRLDELSSEKQPIRTDYTRLKQVMLNLMSNAVKYNRENGTITISCDVEKDKSLRISVTDTGAGLTEDQQNELFKPFNRLGLEDTDIEGTGIGLVITKKIVELMGGHIGVKSKTGTGSTFWFELPMESEQLSDEKISETNEKQDDIKAPDTENKSTVLYIEDNSANLRLVEQILGSISNLHMWSAPEALLGLELAAEHKPDLILLDINLPGMDGFEVLRQLRKNHVMSEIPVIAVSANAMPADIEKGQLAGFDGYITKPINVKELLATVNKMLMSGEK